MIFALQVFFNVILIWIIENALLYRSKGYRACSYWTQVIVRFVVFLILITPFVMIHRIDAVIDHEISRQTQGEMQ